MRDFEARECRYGNSIADRYNRDYHEYPLMRWHARRFVEFLKRAYRPGDRILDLGCGPASLWRYLTKALEAPGALVGVDLSDRMIELAGKAFPGSDFRVGSMFDIPAGAGEFDIVVVSSAFHHVPDSHLPEALGEIHRVLDEHGRIVGREPLLAGRLGDRGGWLAGALMNLRHLAYRLGHTREYPEPDPGPAHHAYRIEAFLAMLKPRFVVNAIEFRNPISPFLARSDNQLVVRIGKLLDEAIQHKEGQEFHYLADKNYASADTVIDCVRLALEENSIADPVQVLALIAAAAQRIEAELAPPATPGIDP